ncbi:MAG TPA: 4Fe-4S double cluster binding domain-containing protein [Methanospirillum sp.]|nr:4Fe-4S double cluster binding domain-containing protein [Methanospirillum sp.]
MSLEETLRQIAYTAGVDQYGIADLSSATEAIQKQGGEEIAAYPRAISIGINLIHPLVDLLPSAIDPGPLLYRHYVYDVVNTRLDLIISQLAGRIQQEGYAAFPVPASKRTNDEQICAFFSHKLAAHCAGLGWIGRSCLLITPDAGPRVRWGSILTNAPLSPTGTPMGEQCGSCRECVDICPVQAFSGETFRKSEPREVRFDAKKCDRYFSSLRDQGKEAVCGLCLYTCPYGKRAADRIIRP